MKEGKMNDIVPILEEYGIELGNYQYVKGNKSYKDGNTVYYKKICDGLTLGCNTEVESLDIQLEKRGLMMDFSRGKVYNVDTVKKMIIKSACMGINYLTMYIEDLINLPGYPQYGYMRGRFSDEEIKEICEFANKIDYQIVPAFQTLGHLEHFLRWDVSDNIKGTGFSLDPLKEETYVFIETLISRMVELFGTDCMNIGLDEAFDLGFNKFNSGKLDQKKLFLEHLSKVVQICKKHGVEKIKMWSDMLFSIYSNTDGNGLYSTDFKSEVERVDESIELIYWNYWTREAEAYKRVLDSHRNFNDNISFAGSVHTSMNLVYEYSGIEITKAAIEGCNNSGIKDILYTMWSEDGTNIVLDTTFLGLYETMREMFNTKASSDDFLGITGYDYQRMKQICLLKSYGLKPSSILWNDPLMDIYYKSLPLEEVISCYEKISRIKEVEETNEIEMYYNVLLRYIKLDIKRYLSESVDPDLIIEIKECHNYIFKYIEGMWMKDGKLHGIEDIQKRFCLKQARYQMIIDEPEATLEFKSEKVEGFIKPRFVQLYSPNKWRF